MKYSVSCTQVADGELAAIWIAADDSIRLGRDVTLQAAPGGEAIFANQ